MIEKQAELNYALDLNNTEIVDDEPADGQKGENEMTVVMLEPGKDAYVKRFRGELSDMKALVGGLSGKLTAGDIVSVYAVLPKTGEDDDYHAILPPELAYVQVLSVTSKLGIDRKESGADQAQAMDEENQPVTVTLLVNVRQAAALAGLNSGAQVHMALVSRGNAAAAQQYLQLQEDYFLAEDEPEDMESEAADLQITDPQDTPDTESEAETIE